MPINHIVFDVGDTLLDTKSAKKDEYRDVFLQFFKELGFKGNEEDIKKAREDIEDYIRIIKESHGDRAKIFLELGKKLGLDISIEQAGKMYKAREDYILKRTQLQEGVREILEYLKSKSIRLFVLSDAWKTDTYSLRYKFKIDHYFERIFTSEEIGARKTTVEPFKFLLKELNANSKEILMVGDSIDRDGNCRELGIWFCLFDSSHEGLEYFDFKIKKMSNLKDVIEFFEKDTEFTCYLCKEKTVRNKLFCDDCREKAIELVLKAENKNGLKDLIKYTNDEEKTALEKIINGPLMVRNDWIEDFPVSEEEIRKFYSESSNYLYDLAMAHSMSHYIEEMEFVIRIAKKHAGKIIDFGAGNGDLSLELAELGLDITHADLPGVVMDYARWRAERRKVEMKFSELTNGLQDSYDCIICMDVIEHMIKPMNLLKNFYDYLNGGGILMINERFQNADKIDKLHPMHLLQNYRFKKEFRKIVESVGFSLVEEFEGLRKDRKIYVFKKAV